MRNNLTFAPAMELAFNATSAMLKNILFVGLGSGLGGAIRYILFIAIDQTGKQHSFPIKTFLVNIIGCFALGLFYGMADRGQFTDNQLILFLTMGLCGGFTTFSAFSQDNIVLLKNGNFLLAMFYVLLTVFLSFIALYLGNKIVSPPV
ncbi:MAG: fluoride efflux transporter CrcB [Bacteroidales bacterium]|nr:fluoride efflux transporter CrcB [Bacteroidales bacterium]